MRSPSDFNSVSLAFGERERKASTNRRVFGVDERATDLLLFLFQLCDDIFKTRSLFVRSELPGHLGVQKCFVGLP